MLLRRRPGFEVPTLLLSASAAPPVLELLDVGGPDAECGDVPIIDTG